MRVLSYTVILAILGNIQFLRLYKDKLFILRIP